jgi:hypothetical protein
MNLLKGYFNSQIKHKFIKFKTKKRKLLKSKRMLPRLRRLSAKRVFIGKGELKHVSSKVIITFYVYNVEGMFLSHKVRKLRIGLFFPKCKLKKTVTKDSKGKEIITYNRLFTMMEYLTLRQQYEGYLSYVTSLVKKQIS